MINDITLKDCQQLSSGIMISANKTALVSGITFSNLTSAGGPQPYLCISESKNLTLSKVKLQNIFFGTSRGIQVIDSTNITLNEIEVTNSFLSENHLIYLSNLNTFEMSNSTFMGLKNPERTIGKLINRISRFRITQSGPD